MNVRERRRKGSEDKPGTRDHVTESKTQSQHCEAPKALGSSAMPLLVASGTYGASGEVGDKAYGLEGFFKNLRSFPTPSTLNTTSAVSMEMLSMGERAEIHVSCMGREGPARADSLSCTYYKSKQVNTD